MGTGVDSVALEGLIEAAMASGGSERANYQRFIIDLCAALGLDAPAYSHEHNHFNDYVFERRLDYKHPDGSHTPMFVDCYRRGSFVLEAKQSAVRQAIAEAQASLFPEEAAQRRAGHARRGGSGWDRVMRNAYRQAVDYTRNLPVEHGYPPFVIVVDVGHVIEIYADFSGQGKNYAQFPDRQSYRIEMDDLRDPQVQQRLRAIWRDPLSLDPARRSAEVTRDIAGRLARIARRLETRHDPRDVAEFLMRCLFTMFAEDVELLPKGRFADLLGQLAERPEAFPPALESLWKAMDEGSYEPHLMASLRRFNGGLFKDRRALALAPEDIHELHVAAQQDWSDVEPAIFGTLLERALDPRERSKLGAHYTPRAYVERLVVPTIIEPLRADWEQVQALVLDLQREGRDAEALAAVRRFHHQLCTTRVLDPACGTGNFLYVALELMKKLEGEVLVALDELGQEQGRLAMDGETVGPRQFHGLELNPRAVPIADLVLWIGYLRWQLRTVGLRQIGEPVLHAYGTIRQQDAILAHDGVELVRDGHGVPVTRWDGVTRKRHPITGEEVPDPDAQVEVWRYLNPRPAEWPEAEFIVGNPPFIGGGQMRAELGDGYVEAIWKARPHLPAKADLVMHFWDEAAKRLSASTSSRLRQFGFITTNSISQVFNRRVVERHLERTPPLSLAYAIPDHPWLKASDKAAVRIALTVVRHGHGDGVLAEVSSESDLETDVPKVALRKTIGRITADVGQGPDLTNCQVLAANAGLGRNGMMLAGSGFILDPGRAQRFLRADPSSGEIIKPYVNGGDLTRQPVAKYVVDCFGYSEADIQTRFPAVYQLLVEAVKPERDQNRRNAFRQRWWVFGEPRKTFRPALKPLQRYIATTETAKHRTFRFVDAGTVPDHMVIAIASEAAGHLATLSSRPHLAWALASGGTLEDRPRYNKSRTFDPFPFPPFSDLAPTLVSHLETLGEHLDAFRKARLAEHGFLTMTGLYNVLERLLELAAGADVPPLTDKERAIHEAGLVSVLGQIHDDIDRAVFAAYGWHDLIPALVGRPGATTPSLHKSAAQQAAEEELLGRLVALNRERVAEEAQGRVRWLRPDYQPGRLGSAVPQGDQVEAELPIRDKAPKWPGDAFEQIRIVRDVLVRAPAPAAPDSIAALFDGRTTGKRRARVEQVLETLVATGAARQLDGARRYFVPR